MRPSQHGVPGKKSSPPPRHGYSCRQHASMSKPEQGRPVGTGSSTATPRADAPVCLEWEDAQGQKQTMGPLLASGIPWFPAHRGVLRLLVIFKSARKQKEAWMTVGLCQALCEVPLLTPFHSASYPLPGKPRPHVLKGTNVEAQRGPQHCPRPCSSQTQHPLTSKTYPGYAKWGMTQNPEKRLDVGNYFRDKDKKLERCRVTQINHTGH